MAANRKICYNLHMQRTIRTLSAVACAVASTYVRAALVAADVAAETWRVTELAFEAGVDYDATGADAVTFDAVFTHESGEKVSRPGFWDGGKTFRVRFAPFAGFTNPRLYISRSPA